MTPELGTAGQVPPVKRDTRRTGGQPGQIRYRLRRE
jgi:hypothetical protein